jgi:hypothetical protein
MSLAQILKEQSERPTTIVQARDQGWKRTKDGAKTAGGCEESNLDQVVINGNSFFKCKPNTGQEETPTPDNSQGGQTTPTPPDNTQGDQSTPTPPDNSQGGQQQPQEPQKSPEEVLRGEMTKMFPIFNFYALKNGKSIRFDVKDVDKDAVLTYIISNTPSGKDVDDRFVHGMISYIISKGGQPFYLTYSRGADGVDGIEGVEEVNTLFEGKLGLESILLEDRYLSEQMAGTEVIYIYAPKTDAGQVDYKLYRGPYAKNKVSDLYNKQSVEVTEPQPNADAKPQEDKGTTTTGETPAADEKRPEEELKVDPKADMVQKKAEKEGVESIIGNLNDYQQRVLKNYTNQDYTTEKPANQDMEIFDIVDLSKTEEAFKDFKTFPVYRPKRMNEANLNAYAEALDAQNVDRKMCKTTVKMFHEAGKEKKRLSDNAKKQFADYITACNYQIKKFMDMGVTKKKIAELENNMSENPSYEINYSARTVGGNKF